MRHSIAIIGASKDKHAFSNKAVRAYKIAGWDVYPVNPKEDYVEGLACYHSVKEIKDQVEYASLYVNPEIGVKLLEGIKEKGINKIFLNPGAQSDEIIIKCTELALEPLMQCSILAVGGNPNE